MPLVVSLLNALSGGVQQQPQQQQHQQQNQQQQDSDLPLEYSFGDFSNILNALFLRARARPQPAAEAAISALQRGPLSSELLARALECAICKEEFAEADIGVTLPCNVMHVFHEPCLLPWLREHHHTCPLCRHKLPIADDSDSSPTPVPDAVSASDAVSVQPINDDADGAVVPRVRAQLRRSRRARRSGHPMADLIRGVDNSLVSSQTVVAAAAAAASTSPHAAATSTVAADAEDGDDEQKRAAVGEHVDDVKRSKRRRRG